MPLSFIVADSLANPLDLGSRTIATSSVTAGTTAAPAGEIRATGNITAYFTSDRRLKTNIQPITEALDRVDRISGVTFNWTDEALAQRGGEDGYFVRRDDVGVIAQELESVLPQAVAARQDGTLAVRYELVVPLLIQAIKELRAEVQALKTQNQ